MKEKIKLIINNLKLKLQSNKKLADLAEKIQIIINNIKFKLETNKFIAGLIEKIQAIIVKTRKKNKTDTEKSNKLKRVWLRKINKIFTLKSVTSVLAVLISVPAILFYIFAFIQEHESTTIDKKSVNSIINSNLNYATLYLIKELKHRKIKRKELRRLIKELNGVDANGNMHKFVPCEESNELMFGETPAPGNVVIIKPTGYDFEITSYSCEMEPLITKTIKLKKPPKPAKTKSEKNKKPIKQVKDGPVKDLQHDTNSHNEPKETNDKPSDKTIPPENLQNKDLKAGQSEKAPHSEPIEDKKIIDQKKDPKTHIETKESAIDHLEKSTSPKTLQNAEIKDKENHKSSLENGEHKNPIDHSTKKETDIKSNPLKDNNDQHSKTEEDKNLHH